jgi:hypothetical protein
LQFGRSPNNPGNWYNIRKELKVQNSLIRRVRDQRGLRIAGSGCVMLAVWLAFVSTSHAAISFVQQKSAVPQAPQTAVSATFSAAQVAGDTNVVAIGWSDSTSTVTSVNDSKGNSYSLVIGPTRQANVQSQAIYVATNIFAAAANTNTVTVTFNAAVPFPDIRILEYSGLDTASPVEGAVGAVGTGTTSNSGNLTTTNPNDLLFAANYVTSGTNAAGTGFTSRVITSPDGDIAEDRIVTATGTYNATASMSSGNWVMQMVALRAAGSQPLAATPTFNPVPGTYSNSVSVSLSDTTAGATIYYTLDGSMPTTSSSVYGSPIVVSSTTTIKAMAAAVGFANSAVATGSYVIQVAAAATPTFNPAPGTYTSAQSVQLQDATVGATIYYTLDGSTPTTSSAVYSSPIQVNATTTIKAMAAASGLANSAVATGTYTIQLPAAATPTFNPAPGNYATAQTVQLADTTAGATIYYTLDGSTPTTSSAVYNPASPLSITNTTTIKAMAAAAGFSNSAVASGTYTIGATPTIAFVQSAYAVPQTAQSTVTVTYSLPQQAGDLNVVAIGWSDSTSSVTSVTDSKGNSYAPAIAPTVQSGVQTQVIYIAKNIVAASAGANSVTVRFSTAVRFPDIRILEYSGLDPVSPLDGTAGASGTGITSNSGPITTTNAYDLIFSANYVTTSTNTSGNGFVSRMITFPDGDIAEDQITTSVATYTGTAQLSSNGSWVMQTIALRSVGGAPPPPPPDPSVVGQWSSVMSWPILPIHVSLMPTGKVLAWGHDATNNTTSATIWDPNTNSFQASSFASADLFCAGHGLLSDGRVFVAGGHNMADYVGLKNATIFNPTTLAWSSAPAMSFARWYPTVTTLGDGRMLVSSGAINCNGCNAKTPEVYDPKTNAWSKLTSAALNIPIYPHMFVLPDGRVLNTGSYELPVPTRALDVNAQTWTTIDPNVLDAGSAVMYLPGKIVKTGTSANSDPPYKTSVSTAYVLDMTQGAPAWRAITPMAFPRTYHNMTVLPDGNVLVTGGVGTTNPDDLGNIIYPAEMWSPTSENFTTMASMVTPRVYHSTALLLPDGRVLVGGGGEYHGTSPDQLNAEIYSPPYLFKGSRPTVTSYPSQIQYGSQFTVQTPDAASITSVGLVRLGSVTHAFNENQRYVPLTFSASVGSLNVQAPANGNIAPPGYYMLFLVNNTGVPSVGVFVQF